MARPTPPNTLDPVPSAGAEPPRDGGTGPEENRGRATGAAGGGRAPGARGRSGPGGTKGKAALSRELSDFLVELSIAMQKHAIYPVGHPLLDAAVDGVMRKLAALLGDRRSLSIGIARRQLIIEGVATDPNHPLLKELSARLHKHALGAIKFSDGLRRDELGDALATIAVDPGRAEKPLGNSANELSERWSHVRLFPLNYERLQLLHEGKDEEGQTVTRRAAATRGAQLWIGMARAALMLDDDAELDDDKTNPLVVAEAIDKRQEEAAYDQVIVGYLLQIAEELKNNGGTAEALELQKRISEMVRKLSPQTLKKLLSMGGDRDQRRQFLLNASQGMTVDAVLELIQAAATDGRQTISHSMMRLFSKLSKYAETDSDASRRANADVSVREQMAKLIAEWDLEDPNPTAYGRALQQMATAHGSRASSAYTEMEPERILQMGLELGTTGPRVDVALDAMLNSARLAQLLDLLDHAPDADVAEVAWQYLDSHGILWAALGEARIDHAVLERIVRRKRLSAVDPILDVAERTADHKQRERLLDVLLVAGDEIAPFVIRRLEGARSELRRDLFLLLGKLSRVPPAFDASRFLLHTDTTVRREAVRLLLKYVESREQAIVAGVTDNDERTQYLALTAAQEGGCPPRAAALIRQRIDAGGLDSSLMTLAIRVLAAADSGAMPAQPIDASATHGRTSTVQRPADAEAVAAGGRKTRQWLISRVAHRSRFLRLWKLNAKTPEMLAALGALAAYWADDPDVQKIVALATKTNDPDFRSSMATPKATGKFRAIAD